MGFIHHRRPTTGITAGTMVLRSRVPVLVLVVVLVVVVVLIRIVILKEETGCQQDSHLGAHDGSVCVTHWVCYL